MSLETLTSEYFALEVSSSVKMKIAASVTRSSTSSAGVAACATGKSQGGKGRANRRNEVIKPGVDYQPGEGKRKWYNERKPANSQADVIRSSHVARRALNIDSLAIFAIPPVNRCWNIPLGRPLPSFVVNAGSRRAARSSRVRNYLRVQAAFYELHQVEVLRRWRATCETPSCLWKPRRTTRRETETLELPKWSKWPIYNFWKF